MIVMHEKRMSKAFNSLFNLKIQPLWSKNCKFVNACKQDGKVQENSKIYKINGFFGILITDQKVNFSSLM